MGFTVVATNGRHRWFRVSPGARRAAPVTSECVAWAVWLSIPLLATVLAALWAWVRGRPPAPLDTAAAIRAHQSYLEALTVPARGTARPLRDEDGGAVPSDDD